MSRSRTYHYENTSDGGWLTGITTEWHPTLYKPVTITEPDRVLSFEYDSQGNLLSQTITAL